MRARLEATEAARRATDVERQAGTGQWYLRSIVAPLYKLGTGTQILLQSPSVVVGVDERHSGHDAAEGPAAGVAC